MKSYFDVLEQISTCGKKTLHIYDEIHCRHKRASYCENWSEDEDNDPNYTPENSDIDEEEKHAMPEVQMQTPKRKRPKSNISTPRVA